MGRGIVQGIAATGAAGAGDGWKFMPAGVTDWHRGKLRQEGAAEGTGSGKKSASESIQWTSENAGHCAPTGNLRWRDVDRHGTGVPAEDAPHLERHDCCLPSCDKYTCRRENEPLARLRSGPEDGLFRARSIKWSDSKLVEQSLATRKQAGGCRLLNPAS
jgi:hypothetical protein